MTDGAAGNGGERGSEPLGDVTASEVYRFLTTRHLHQDRLSWSRTQILVAVQAGAIAGAFSRPDIAPYGLILGTFLIAVLWLLVERDWEIRDHGFVPERPGGTSVIDAVHKRCGVAGYSEPKYSIRRGSFLLRGVFILFIIMNVLLSIAFAIAPCCNCDFLAPFRVPTERPTGVAR